MDDLSRVQEHTSDVSVTQESQGVLWQAGGRPRNTAKRRPRKAGSGQMMPPRQQPDMGEAPAPSADGADVPIVSADGQDPSSPCYGPDKSLTPTVPSKGTHIDVAI